MHRSFLLALSVLFGCDQDNVRLGSTPSELGPAGPTLAPPDPAEGFQMAIDTTVAAGEEAWDCWVGDVPLTELTAIDHVVSQQVEGVHHMDVLALSLLPIEIEDGLHDCRELYAEYPDLMDGTFIYASQLPEDELVLPDGVAAVLPPNLRVMIEIHYVNWHQEDLHAWSRINAYTVPMDEVQEQIWGSAVRDTEISVPAGAEDHVEWTRCVMNRDVNLVFSASHTHQLASLVEVFAFDGESTGELLYTTDDWHAPVLHRFDLRPIAAGTGFEFRCHYDNPGVAEVNWGFSASDEMCQIGIVHTPGDFSAACDIVGSSDGLMP
jgi:hypothetical protein